MLIADTSRVAALAAVSLLGCSGFVLQAQNISFLRSKDVPIGPPAMTIEFPSKQNLSSGDFNGDGKLDLVVSGSKAMLLLSNGDGTFRSVDLGFFAQFTLVADVNRDKKADLLVYDGANFLLPKAFLMLGNGDGTFQPPKPLPAFPLAVADFNGDGNPDLLAAGDGQQCFGDQLSVYPGNGDGTFRSPLACSSRPFGTVGGTRTVAVADVNNDGKLDVVWGDATHTSAIFLWLGNGDGTFQTPAAIDAGVGQGGKPLAVGDLNHDGKPDIVVGFAGGVSVLLGNGDGTFRRATGFSQGMPVPPLLLSPFDGHAPGPRRWFDSNDIFLRDFDGDGNLDIVCDDLLFRGNGDGTFQPAQFLNAGSVYAFSLICDDLNGDGKPDLVYLDQYFDPITGVAGSAKLSILLNNSPNGLPNAVLGYSAATGDSLMAQGSIGSIYGKALAKATASAVGATFPTQLGGVSLRVRDDTDTVRLAPLIYVSPTQINFQVPVATDIGPVTLTIDDGSTPLQESANATIVSDVAAGFFTANGFGQGVAAATALRMRTDGTRDAVDIFSCTSAGHCSAVPIDMTSGLPVYLTLYGTGFSNATRYLSGAARCQVGGKDATVLYAGPQPVYPGLDQLNLLLPQSLPSGVLPVRCQFYSQSQSSGSVSNVVQIAIK
jgi:uncharacterized protein (TIGR03437 family)